MFNNRKTRKRSASTLAHALARVGKSAKVTPASRPPGRKWPCHALSQPAPRSGLLLPDAARTVVEAARLAVLALLLQDAREVAARQGDVRVRRPQAPLPDLERPFVEALRLTRLALLLEEQREVVAGRGDLFPLFFFPRPFAGLPFSPSFSASPNSSSICSASSSASFAASPTTSRWYRASRSRGLNRVNRSKFLPAFTSPSLVGYRLPAIASCIRCSSSSHSLALGRLDGSPSKHRLSRPATSSHTFAPAPPAPA